MSLMSCLLCVKNHALWFTGKDIKMDTNNELAVSAKAIVVLRIEISCNSLIALVAFEGHANVTRVDLYVTFALFDALSADHLCVFLKSCGKSSSISVIACLQAPIAPSLPIIFSRTADSSPSHLFRNSRSWKIVLHF